MVAGWVRDAQELFWLAPSVTPPLTADKVAAWTRESGSPFLLLDEDQTAIGYAELNPMRESPSHWWIGHLLLDPVHRGGGKGETFTRLLLEQAFAVRQARTVSLIVFPHNKAAIRCYLRAGFEVEGEQFHAFGTSSTKHRMLHLIAGSARQSADQRRPRHSAANSGLLQTS